MYRDAKQSGPQRATRATILSNQHIFDQSRYSNSSASHVVTVWPTFSMHNTFSSRSLYTYIGAAYSELNAFRLPWRR